MACEVKYNTSHHAGADADARIRNRLRPSNDTANAESVTTVGHSPTRTVTSIHHSRVHRHGEVNPGEGDIRGHKRGVV
jgi:hypothetical protein